MSTAPLSPIFCKPLSKTEQRAARKWMRKSSMMELADRRERLGGRCFVVRGKA